MDGIGTIHKKVLAAVSREFNVTREDLMASSRRNQDIAWARQIAIHLCRELSPKSSWSELGRRFGRDRTTIRHAHFKVAEWRGQGEDLDNKLREIESECSAATI